MSSISMKEVFLKRTLRLLNVLKLWWMLKWCEIKLHWNLAYFLAFSQVQKLCWVWLPLSHFWLEFAVSWSSWVYPEPCVTSKIPPDEVDIHWWHDANGWEASSLDRLFASPQVSSRSYQRCIFHYNITQLQEIKKKRMIQKFEFFNGILDENPEFDL